ncbi:hypothetical protein D3C87_1316330 [compost metagenome]
MLEFGRCVRRPLTGKWHSLAVVLDICAHRIVGGALSEKLDAELVIKALDTAYEQRGRPKDEIFLATVEVETWLSLATAEKLPASITFMKVLIAPRSSLLESFNLDFIDELFLHNSQNRFLFYKKPVFYAKV